MFVPVGGPWLMSGSRDSLKEKLSSVGGLEGLNTFLHHHRIIPTNSMLRNTGKRTQTHTEWRFHHCREHYVNYYDIFPAALAKP